MPDLSKKQLIIIAVIAGVILLGFIWRARVVEERRLVGLALQELSQVTSAKANVKLELQLPFLLGDQERPFNKITLEVDGDIVKNAEAKAEFIGTMMAEARGRGNAFFTSGDLAILTDAVAFRLNEFPALLNPTGSLVDTWTQVDSSLLNATHPEPVAEAAVVLANIMEPQGKEVKDGKRVTHFIGVPSAEEEERIARNLSYEVSGSHVLDQLSSLLDGNSVKQVDVYVDPTTREIVEITVEFIKLVENEESTDTAFLTMSFTEYNKEASIERPPVEATVRPDVFGKLFGAGQVGTLEVEEQ